MSFSTNSGDNKGLFTEINITPLTDIFLVLLIIMMVIAPSFQSVDQDINIPEINSGVAVEQKNAEISVTKHGHYYINGRPIKSENLVAELTQLKPTLEKAEVVVKADTDTKSSEIQKIMKAAQEAEYAKLVLAGEPLTKKEQKSLEEQKNIKPISNNVPKEQRTEMKTIPINTDWDE